MKYTLELDIREGGSNVVFNNILLNSFKINIVERYSYDKAEKLQLREVLFKVRTLDDQIIKKKDGTPEVQLLKKKKFLLWSSSHLQTWATFVSTLDVHSLGAVGQKVGPGWLPTWIRTCE